MTSLSSINAMGSSQYAADLCIAANREFRPPYAPRAIPPLSRLERWYTLATRFFAAELPAKTGFSACACSGVEQALASDAGQVRCKILWHLVQPARKLRCSSANEEA